MSKKIGSDLGKLDELYDSVATPIFVIQPSDMVIFVANKAAEKFVGYTGPEIEGKTFLSIFPPEEHQKLEQTILAGIEFGFYSDFNIKLVRKSGRILIVNLSGKDIYINKIKFISIVLQDITELTKSYELLEEKVRIRTTDLNNSKIRIQAILNSSLQGFLTFSQTLQIDPDYSSKAQDILGSELAGKNVCSILNINPETLSEFTKLAFQLENWDILERLAAMESRVNGKTLKIEFAPVKEDGKIVRILCAITDITPLKRLEQRAEKFAKETRAIIKILQSKPVFFELIRIVSTMDENEDHGAKRYVHTMKGEFSFFECQELVEICQHWEEVWLEGYNKGDFALFLKQFRSTLNKFLDKYRHVLRLGPSEQSLIVKRDQIKKLVVEINALGPTHSLVPTVEAVIERPIEECLEWLGETWLMVAGRLGKNVNPIQWRCSSRLYEEPYKKLLFALVHAVRNSADHGIETPTERIAAGKKDSGNLVVEFDLIAGHYHLKMTDDGRGMPFELVRTKALAKGLPLPKNEEEAYQLLFDDRMTTRDIASQISGRGIGLNAIRFEARLLGGDATVRNVPAGGLELHIWFKKIAILEAVSQISK